MILDCEETGNWTKLKEIINGQRDKKIQARRELDRARSQNTKPELRGATWASARGSRVENRHR
jgi:hypothetical protein